MTHSFVAYIDESGDDGFKKFRQPRGEGGSSKWLCICACIIHTSQESDVVQWRDKIRKTTNNKQNQKRAIHFAKFNHNQKRVACQILKTKEIKIVSAICDKTKIQKNKYDKKNHLYFYMTSLVIERMSWLCRDYQTDASSDGHKIKIIFSRRGGMSYPDFRDYLYNLKDTTTDRDIDWSTIDIDGIEAQDHRGYAGLQLADCGASAITTAFEKDKYGNVETQYLQELRDVIYNHKGEYVDYGLTFVPDFDKLELTPQQQNTLQPTKQEG